MTNFDLIGAIAATASAAAVAGTLVPAGFSGTASRFGVGSALLGWFSLIVAGGATLFFNRQAALGTAWLGIAVLLPIVVAVVLAISLPTFRRAIRAVPLPALIAVNAVRVAGILFVLLYAFDKLPAPFAPAAGYGDIITGASAPLVAWLAWRQAPGWRGAAWLWNLFGAADLFVAIGLGVVSADGSPVQLIFATPNTSLMTSLPWILIPAFLVPLLMLTHIAVFDRLVRESRGGRSVTRHIGSWAASLSE